MTGHDSLLVTHPANVRYLTGFTGSSGCALITRRRRLFFTDFRYRAQAARQVKKFQARIIPGSLLEGVCHYIVSRRISLGVLGFDAVHLSYHDYRLLRRLLKRAKLTDASGVTEELRQRKSRVETDCIKQASAIADEAFRKLCRIKVVGKTEREIAWILGTAMRAKGAEGMPFEIIVASGHRSAMPHGASSDKVIRRGELVVVDMGAAVGGYCCDATRTFTTGRLPATLKSIYQIVKEAQELALAAAVPGAGCADIDAIARNHINAAGYGADFGHSTGHGVGLEAHEAPVLSARSKDVLQTGMTVTVEPGIYIEGAGGVRIEDTLLVGAKSPQLLTRFPRELITLR